MICPCCSPSRSASNVTSLFDQLVPQHPNGVGDLNFGQVVVGWQVYLLSQCDPRLNHVQDWVEKRLNIYAAPVRALDFSDDRPADLLDKLSAATNLLGSQNDDFKHIAFDRNARARSFDLELNSSRWKICGQEQVDLI